MSTTRSDAPVRAETPPPAHWKTALKVIAALAAVAALFWLGREAGDYVPRFREWVEALGFWGPFVFVAGYAVATIAFLPGSLLTAAAGIAFGLVAGTVYAFTGATLGASAAFLIARYGARGWVEKKIEGRPKFRAIDLAVGREGGKVVALLRLIPLFPFNLLNYALGLTRVKFLHYLVASLAMLPGTLLYVYYGKVAGDVASAAGGESGKTVFDWVLLGVGLAAVIALTVLVTRRARKVFEQEVEVDLEKVETAAEAGEGGTDG